MKSLIAAGLFLASAFVFASETTLPDEDTPLPDLDFVAPPFTSQLRKDTCQVWVDMVLLARVEPVVGNVKVQSVKGGVEDEQAAREALVTAVTEDNLAHPSLLMGVKLAHSDDGGYTAEQYEAVYYEGCKTSEG